MTLRHNPQWGLGGCPVSRVGRGEDSSRAGDRQLHSPYGGMGVESLRTAVYLNFVLDPIFV